MLRFFILVVLNISITVTVSYATEFIRIIPIFPSDSGTRKGKMPLER